MHSSQWIILPSQSFFVLYSFCANLLHSLMWLMISFLSPLSLLLLFCCILSILALIWLILMALLLLLLLLLLLFNSSRIFYTSESWWAYQLSPSDSKSLKVSRTLLSIRTNLNNAVVWMILTLPPISNCSNPLSNFWVLKRYITVSHLFQRFSSFYYYHFKHYSFFYLFHQVFFTEIWGTKSSQLSRTLLTTLAF